MERSDFDYALSLHYMLNGESAIEELSVNEDNLVRKEENEVNVVQKIPVRQQKI